MIIFQAKAKEHPPPSSHWGGVTAHMLGKIVKSVKAWAETSERSLREYARDKGMHDYEEANIAAVIGFVVTAIVLSLGVIILYQVQTATPEIPNTSVWATTQATLATTTQSGYGLLGITLIVMAAVAILGSLFVLIRGRED